MQTNEDKKVTVRVKMKNGEEKLVSGKWKEVKSWCEKNEEKIQLYQTYDEVDWYFDDKNAIYPIQK